MFGQRENDDLRPVCSYKATAAGLLGPADGSRQSWLVFVPRQEGKGRDAIIDFGGNFKTVFVILSF